MATCDNVPLASQIEEFVEDMAYVQTFVETDALTATTPQGKVRTTLAGVEAASDAAIAAVGFVFLDPLTFETGATLTGAEQALYWSPADGGNGFYYRWSGVFPPGGKIVPPASTPVGDPLWVAVQNNLSYVQDDRPPTNTLIGSRWWQTKVDGAVIAQTMLKVKLNGNAHWLQEFVVGQSGSASSYFLDEYWPDAGTGGDDSEAFLAAFAQSKVIELTHGKTYLLDPALFVGEIFDTIGMFCKGRATIKCINQLPVTDLYLLNLRLLWGGDIYGIHIDGNLSDDPVTWNSSNYNTWSGSGGLRIIESANVNLKRVSASNVFGPGLAVSLCENVSLDLIYINRSRGNFGDGIFISESKRITRKNCYVEDFTRIAFTTDKTTGDACENITSENCWADYGHDASINYGGGEYNSLFWDEFSTKLHYHNCGGTRPGNGLARGFTLQMAADATGLTPEIFNSIYSNTYVDGDGEAGYGYIISSLGDTRFTCILDTAIAVNCQIKFGLLGNKNLFKLRGCVGVDSTELVTGGVVRQTILWTGGEISVEGCREYINLPTGRWSGLDDDVAICSIGSFDLERPTSVRVVDFKSYQFDTDVQIPSRFQHDFGERADWYVEDAWLDQDLFVCRDGKHSNTRISAFGSVDGTGDIDYDSCNLTLSNLPAGGVEKAILINETGTVKIRNCTGEITGTDSIYLFNNGFNNLGRVQIYDNVITKEMDQATAVEGAIIRLNEAPSAFNTSDLQHIDLSRNTFINSGAATSNPIVHSYQRATVGNSATVRVYGESNYKSANIAQDVTPGVTRIQLIVTSFDDSAPTGALAVVPIGSGGNLKWGAYNQISGSYTVTAPLAASTYTNGFLVIYVAASDAPLTLTVNRSGSDLFELGAGTDTSITLNFTAAGSYVIKSNGSNRLEM
jgi:hypothetical protein